MPTEASPLLVGSSKTTRKHLLNYVCFSAAFGCAYGSLKASTAFLSSLFPHDVASTGNAFQYGFWMTSSLFCAAAVTRRLGSKHTLVSAQVFAALYQLLLLVASAIGAETSTATSLVWSAGVLAGLAAAHLWTAQGVYFAHAAQLYAVALNDPSFGAHEAMSWMASIFAALFMGIEVLARCGAATVVLLSGSGVGMYVYLFCLPMIAVIVTSLLFDVDAMVAAAEAREPRKTGGKGGEPSASSKTSVSALSTLKLLFTDPRTLLLVPTNMAKGAAETFMSDYVNGDLIKGSMGVAAIGYISGGAALVAASVGLVTTVVQRRCGRQVTMQLGHVAWIVLGAIPMAALAAVDSADVFEQMPEAAWLAIGCYLAYAAGRGVWESTNRYVSAALFPQQLEEIFALIRFSEGISATTLFLMCGRGTSIDCHSGSPIDNTLVVVGALALPCYFAAEWLSSTSRQQPASASADSVLISH